MQVIIFDEDGPHFLSDLTPSQLHSTIANALGEPPQIQLEIEELKARLAVKRAEYIRALNALAAKQAEFEAQSKE